MGVSQTKYTIEACASLIEEHRQVEKLLNELDAALENLDSQRSETVQAVQDVMHRIEPEMNTHFACEEQVLFPAVSPYHSMVLMEVEHEEIVALRNGILDLLPEPGIALQAEKQQQIQDIGRRFIKELLDHIGREDHGIFPTCEQALSVEEKRQVIEGMDVLRAQAKEHPVPAIHRPDRSFQVAQADLAALSKRPIFSERLLEDGSVEVKHLTVRAGETLASHWSPKQITLVGLQGEGRFQAQDRTVTVQPGTCIVMSPQLLHAFEARTDCHLLLILHPA